jgi:hypothetical protein
MCWACTWVSHGADTPLLFCHQPCQADLHPALPPSFV